MTCHLHQSYDLRVALEREYARMPNVVRVRDISCVGRCDHAPVVAINDRYYESVTHATAKQLIDREVKQDTPAGRLHISHNAPPRSAEQRGITILCDPYPNEQSRYGSIRKLIAKKNFDEVLQILKTAELRGMGGAGFPTYIKWDGCRRSFGDQKYVVCNADESEPGTIKDPFIAAGICTTHMVIEGMMPAYCRDRGRAQRLSLYPP